MSLFETVLRERVLAFHTWPADPVWWGLPDSDWGGEGLFNSPNINLTRPDLVLDWYKQLVEAGTDAVEAFTLNVDVPTQLNSPQRCREWNHAAVSLAREAAKNRFVIGGICVGDSLTFCANFSLDEAALVWTRQIEDLWSGGVDAIHLAWVQDSKNLDVALGAVDTVQRERSCRIPIIVSFDIDYQETILTGERPEDLWGMLQPHEPAALALVTYGNGGAPLRRLRDLSKVPVGLLIDPFPPGNPEVTPPRPIEWIAECLGPLLDEQLLSFCGLSCTIPSIDYIRAVSDLIRTKSQA